MLDTLYIIFLAALFVRVGPLVVSLFKVVGDMLANIGVTRRVDKQGTIATHPTSTQSNNQATVQPVAVAIPQVAIPVPPNIEQCPTPLTPSLLVLPRWAEEVEEQEVASILNDDAELDFEGFGMKGFGIPPPHLQAPASSSSNTGLLSVAPSNTSNAALAGGHSMNAAPATNNAQGPPGGTGNLLGLSFV